VDGMTPRTALAIVERYGLGVGCERGVGAAGLGCDGDPGPGWGLPGRRLAGNDAAGPALEPFGVGSALDLVLRPLAARPSPRPSFRSPTSPQPMPPPAPSLDADELCCRC
jgi:hypothetical protein